MRTDFVNPHLHWRTNVVHRYDIESRKRAKRVVVDGEEAMHYRIACGRERLGKSLRGESKRSVRDGPERGCHGNRQRIACAIDARIHFLPGERAEMMRDVEKRDIPRNTTAV
jgi:hypothetical protein